MSVGESRIKAVGYDVDGTMVNSEPLHVAAWREAVELNQRNFADLPLEFQATMAGRKPHAIASFMVEELSMSTTAEEFLAQKHGRFMDQVRTGLQPMPGVVESVRRLGKEYMLGIGTSLDREYVGIVLARLGIEHAFSDIVTGDQIQHGKPDPETYQVLANKMHIEPGEMVVLEDATSGVASAKAAGAWCIVVENLQAVPQDTSQADIVVRSLDEVTTQLVHNLGR
jgi:HAD superfamily hydrolase (TIGR01509 family)